MLICKYENYESESFTSVHYLNQSNLRNLVNKSRNRCNMKEIFQTFAVSFYVTQL